LENSLKDLADYIPNPFGL